MAGDNGPIAIHEHISMVTAIGGAHILLHLRLPDIHYNGAAGCGGQPVKGQNIRNHIHSRFQFPGKPNSGDSTPLC
ncbi:hypothetical protein D3C81_2213290 [compost metagenome]